VAGAGASTPCDPLRSRVVELPAALTADGVDAVVRQVSALLATSAAGVVVDVRNAPADLRAVDALARLALAARRHGARIGVRCAAPDLVRLLGLTGLSNAVPLVGGSGVEGLGQPEPGQQPGVEEVVQVPDPAVRDLDDL
jgi:STAS domain